MAWRHFTPEEFACRCRRPDCAAPPPASALLDMLDGLREELGRPLLVTSGSRCPEHNAAVGGAPSSAHLTGYAADLRCLSSRERYALVALACARGFRRLGVAARFIHLDVHPTLAQEVLWPY